MLVFAVAYYFLMPVAEVAAVRRGTAISAVYGTVRIEPAFVVRVRAQNDGFIRLAEAFSAGRGAIGKSVEKGQLLATIADEETSRQLKQARADLQAAIERAALPLPRRSCSKPPKTICNDWKRLSHPATCPQSNTRRRKAKRTGCAAQWRPNELSGIAISTRSRKRPKNWRRR